EETIIERDALGQITAKRSSDGSFASFRYNEYGQIVEARNQSVAVRFERDTYGRVTREIQGEHFVESVYDRRGLRTRRITSAGKRCDWAYDDNGLPEALRLSNDQLLEFNHDVVGRETQRRFGDSFSLRQSYNTLDKLTEQRAGVEDSAVVERSYRYDINRNPVEIDDRRWGKTSFEYDSNGRIQNASCSNGESEEFRYDPAGYIIKSAFRLGDTAKHSQTLATLKSHFFSRGGRLEQAEDRRYFYDEDGRVIEKQENGKAWKYEWTAEGQLRSVLTPSGERWNYEYDAFGRRIRKQGSDTSIAYVWDGAVVAEEIRRGPSEAEGMAIGWVFEPGSFRPLAKQEKGQTYLCVTDQVGTPRELIDSLGELAWSARFSVWGQVQEQTTNTTECPIRFQGQWFDEESGLHYNWHRYYDPETGRYLSPDPLGLQGGLRSFGYVHNPLGWVDPLGLTNLNTNGAEGDFGIYEITKDGKLYKIGKADLGRVTQSSGQPTRLHQQVRKLGEQNPDSVVEGEVVEEGYKTTAEAKTAETRRLQQHFDETGEIPEGNKKSFKPSGGKCG
ncbi:MAG: RHS repeat domain-containing protein, partial [Bryobacteraceae bacterium]